MNSVVYSGASHVTFECWYVISIMHSSIACVGRWALCFWYLSLLVPVDPRCELLHGGEHVHVHEVDILHMRIPSIAQ